MADFRLVIKGSQNIAAYEARRRLFIVTDVVDSGSRTTTILLAKHANTSAAAKWLAEGPNRPPFPDGALLFFQNEDTGAEGKQVWIAKHGWDMDDDLDGLGSLTTGDAIVEYQFPEGDVAVFDGGRYHPFRVEVYRARNGMKKLVLSEASSEKTEGEAAMAVLRRAVREGMLPNTVLARLFAELRKQTPAPASVRPQPRRKGWNVPDDLEGHNTPVGEYDLLGEIVVSVWKLRAEGFDVDIYAGSGSRTPTRIYSKIVVDGQTPFEAAVSALWSAIHDARVQGTYGPAAPNMTHWEALKKLSKTQRGRGPGWQVDSDLDGLDEFHPWSVSTLVPGLHGKPVYRYFDDFGSALRYARDRVRKGKRLSEGGKAYFILSYGVDNPTGAAAFRVFRAFLGAEQSPGGQHHTVRREFVIVQQAAGTVPGKPDKTHWKMHKAHSVEIR